MYIQVYSELDGASHVVNTAWAMLGLMMAKYHEVNSEQLHRAARYLLETQRAEGDWPQQQISGVFNRSCMISYTNYRQRTTTHAFKPFSCSFLCLGTFFRSGHWRCTLTSF